MTWITEDEARDRLGRLRERKIALERALTATEAAIDQAEAVLVALQETS